MTRHCLLPGALAAACLPCAHAQSAAPAEPAQRIEIVGIAPLGGLQPRDRIPGNVQSVNGERLRELGPLNLPELLGRHLGSVNVNETQGNPFQVEVNYRGFSASPLLGAPQGLSVYVDGVANLVGSQEDSERLREVLTALEAKQRLVELLQHRIRDLIWRLYASLKVYQLKPGKRRAIALRARFDHVFRRRTGFATLDRLLTRLHANKAELLMVLEQPEIPLHTNGSENDIRCQVTRRKVSAGTRSDIGRDCRDAFLGLIKTCDKLGIAVWDYLGNRLGVAGHTVIHPLEHYVREQIRHA